MNAPTDTPDRDESTASATARIVESLTRAIVEHRLHPGTKLAEQKLADHFGVSRTLIRQALFQMARNHLIRMEPARGAFVSTPSATEARQVFAVRPVPSCARSTPSRLPRCKHTLHRKSRPWPHMT
jgi:DNA-binding GntR family transcriptional regulator